MSLAILFFNYHNDARSNKHKINQGLEENIASIYKVEKQTTLIMNAIGFTKVSDGCYNSTRYIKGGFSSPT